MSSQRSISFSFDLATTVTPSGNSYDPDKIATKLTLAGKISGTEYGNGTAFPCSGALSAAKGAQGFSAVDFDDPDKGDVTASTQLPSGPADGLASSYKGTLPECLTGPSDGNQDLPGDVQDGSKSVNTALYPTLTLPPNDTHVSEVFDASAHGASISTGFNSVTIRATMTVQPAAPYVALGDSFTAGAIAPAYDGDAACWRSSDAYPVGYDNKVLFLACSGASPAQIEKTQVTVIPTDTKLVSLTAGGDDADVDLMAEFQWCVIHAIFHLGKCENHAPMGLRDDSTYHRLRGTLVDLLNDIHKQAPHAKIYVMGYPDPLPEQISRDGCKAIDVPGGVKKSGLADKDLPFLRGLLAGLNKAVESAATARSYSHYVEPFTGQDICSDGPAFAPVKLNPGAGADDAALHPNVLGQHEMATLLRKAAGAPPQ